MSLNRTKLSTAAGVSAAIFLLDWFYLTYVISYGFEAKTQNFMLGSLVFSIPIQLLPVLGVLLVSLVGWYEVSERIIPRRAGPEVDPLARARFMRAIAFSIMAFVCVLYIPYLTGSNWFWAGVSRLGRGIPQFLGLRALLNAQMPLMVLDPLWKYSLSQILATGAMIIVAWVFGRVAKRPRRPR